jgi:hypothetical protein
MNPHLEGIPSLRSLTTRRLSGRNLQGLGWKADWALDAEVLGLGALDELLADFLEGGDFSAGQGDADLVGFLDRDNISKFMWEKEMDYEGKTYGALAEIFLFIVGHLD